MPDKNKNMDNEQTIYISGDDDGTANSGENMEQTIKMPQPQNPPYGEPTVLRAQAPQNPPNVEPTVLRAQTLQNPQFGTQPGRPPQMPQNPQFGTQPGRTPQMPQNPQFGTQPGRTPQMPQNLQFGAQPGRPPQNNMYGMPAGYADPRMRQAASGYGGKRKKNNTAVIVLIVITVLLMLIIGGVAAFMVLNNDDDDDDGDSRHKGVETSSEYRHNSDTDEDDDYRDNEDDDKNDEDDDSSVYEETTQVTTEEKTEPVTTEPPTAAPTQKLITTPDVRNQDGNSAAAKLKDMGFVVEIENQYSSEPAGIVIAQNVAAGTSVTEGTRIIITVSQGEKPAEEVPVPDVRGMTEQQAFNLLTQNGFNVISSITQYSPSVAYGCVIDQNIAPGTKTKKGTSVQLTVSLGSKYSGGDWYGIVITKETELNVRKGPGKQFEVIGTVPKDGYVEIVSQNGDWYEIVFKNEYGYVHKDYIQLMSW